MAYRRDSIFETPLLQWQQLTLLSADAGWTDAYRVDSPRLLLLPAGACFEASLGRASFVCDPGSALWLSPEDSCRLKYRWIGQRSALMCVAADLGPSRRVAVPLSAHLRLGLWRQAVAHGEAEVLALERRVLLALPPRPHLPRVHRALAGLPRSVARCGVDHDTPAGAVGHECVPAPLLIGRGVPVALEQRAAVVEHHQREARRRRMAGIGQAREESVGRRITLRPERRGGVFVGDALGRVGREFVVARCGASGRDVGSAQRQEQQSGAKRGHGGRHRVVGR
jgi:hypothetical protein